ncbi:MAG: hypothetical protein ACRYGF_05055 [Janthinobacterium lividum]
MFAVAFDVEHSVLVRKSTGYGVGLETDTFSPSSITVDEQEHWGRMPTKEPLLVGWRSSSLYRYYNFIIYMTPAASANDRPRYTAFNYGCLWKYKGCKDARELLPTADQMPADE